ncbi:CRISPR-associated helicase Cas3' [Amycolatopsis sp. NPDC059021]|uniref:CRISPR-associated helicase Cas3' n=1 Tax=Amycolatopsis sp. NPDC059021 TaxID=3346704 RepID=UPI003671CE8E
MQGDGSAGVPVFGAPWGKSAGRTACHPLICHLLDTAAVARILAPVLLGARRWRVLRESCASLRDPLSWVALLCGIHDIGKYSPTFQSLNFPLAVTRLGPWAVGDLTLMRKPAGVSGRVDTPHGLLTAQHVKDLLLSWGATRETAIAVAVALGGHHGHFPASSSVAQARSERNAHGEVVWARRRTELVGEVVRLLGLHDPRSLPWHEIRLSLDALTGLAALATVSDWIASDEAVFPPPEEDFDLTVYAKDTQVRAEAAVARLGMTHWRPPARTTFAALFPGPPFPVQAVVERATEGISGPVMLLVEAPTGEGKSKAALQAAATMVRRLGMAGVYVAMPTQATSNQMRAVIEAMLAELGDETPVHLAHSGARDHLVTRPSDVGHDDPRDVAAQAWFTRKRNLLATLDSGTVDQALKGAIRSGHVFVRLAALANKVVVFDEVHAYDVYMSTLLERLLMWLGALGTPVVLLSATLPAKRRHDLLAAWQAGIRGRHPREIADTPSTPYPAVIIADSENVAAHAADVSPVNKDRVIHFGHVADADVVDWLLAHAMRDRCVVVIHNLVRRAVATYDALEQRIALLPEDERPALIAVNGTLPAGQRQSVEERLRDYFGPGGNRPRRAIVVGTQVLEQSLDLDFDGMLSDLAPIDAMIQRAGRVHRHRRDVSRGPRVLAVTGVADTPSGPVFPRYLRAVYAPIVLMRTWALLKDSTRIESPVDIPGLVDRVYGERVECPSGWETMWHQESENFKDLTAKDRKAAQTRYLPLPYAVEDLSELTERPKWTQTRKPGKRR